MGITFFPSLERESSVATSGYGLSLADGDTAMPAALDTSSLATAQRGFCCLDQTPARH